MDLPIDVYMVPLCALRRLFSAKIFIAEAANRCQAGFAQRMGVERLFRGRGDLVAGVHEGTPPALRTQVGVVDGGATLLRAEAARQKGIGAEFGRSSAELTRMAQEHSGAAAHGLNGAADMHVDAAVGVQLADFIMVFPQALNGEPAGIVRGIRGADVEEAGSIGKFDYIIDMGGDADVFIEELRGLIEGDAGLLRGRAHGGRDEKNSEQGKAAHAHCTDSLRKDAPSIARFRESCD